MPSNDRLRRQLDDPLLSATHPLFRPLLWTVLATVLLFIAWAAWAELDEVTRGDGRVVPFTRIQKIQSLEGGILDRLLCSCTLYGLNDEFSCLFIRTEFCIVNDLLLNTKCL